MNPRLKAKWNLFWEKYWLYIVGILVLGITVLYPIFYIQGMEGQTRDYIIAHNVVSMPFWTLNTALFVLALWMMQTGGFAQLNKRKIDAGMVAERFSDVVGLEEAKREAWEVVEMIKDRTRLRKMGGKFMKGVLMMGPPGCGKTLLAKAIASEAGLPFLNVAGSEFVEVFVGVGASRIRKLFSRARAYAEAHGGAIIFIDELDVVGKKRVMYDAFGGSSESNSTLNQLLVEMDGIHESTAPVIVIGATNAPEASLDEALLRPGRFDRRIQVSKPNLSEREEIFRYYLRKIKFDEGLDTARLARQTVGKSPADIMNIVMESAVIAARKKLDAVSTREISGAIERIELGVAHRLNMTVKEREMTAYHEAGHLVMLYLKHPTRDVFKASIIQRGGALGVVHSMPVEELHCADRQTVLGHIEVALGGYCAEKIQYKTTTDGVSSDFRVAMQFAHAMVWNFGMGGDDIVGDFTAIPPELLSDDLKTKLNERSREILKQSADRVDAFLKERWEIVERFAKELMEHDELDYDDIVRIFEEFGHKPKVAGAYHQYDLPHAGSNGHGERPGLAEPLPAKTKSEKKEKKD